MLKLVIAAAVIAALAFGGFRVLGNEDSSPARALETPAREIAAELQRATARADAAKAKPRWVRQANALCRAERRELEALPRPSSVDEFVPYLRRAIRIAERYEKRALRLPVPASDMRTFVRLNALSARGLELLRKMLRAAERNDTRAVLDRAQDAIALAHEMNPLLRELRLDDCAMPPSGLAA
jgi:hypothetical protein